MGRIQEAVKDIMMGSRGCRRHQGGDTGDVGIRDRVGQGGLTWATMRVMQEGHQSMRVRIRTLATMRVMQDGHQAMSVRMRTWATMRVMQEGHQAMRGNRVAEDAAETLRETASCHHVRRASRFSKVVGIVDTSVATVTKGGRAGRKLTADKTTAWPCDFELHAISQAITTYGVAQGLPRKGILWQESRHRHGKFSQFIGGREGRRGGGSRRP